MRIPRSVAIEKEVGETPLQSLDAYRARHPELAHIPMTYAGRLDPMASGKLLILLGDECKHQNAYRGLDKEYEFTVLFGVSSDTGDILGRLAYGEPPHLPDSETIRSHIRSWNDSSRTLPYPAFSSKTVHGKPLHEWAREGLIETIPIPTYTAPLYTIDLIRTEERTGADIARAACARIDMLYDETGNAFRQNDVRADWERFAENHAHHTYLCATFRIRCGSGMYMRTLATEIARAYGTRGLAFSIHRTRIGIYVRLCRGMGFFRRMFRHDRTS